MTTDNDKTVEVSGDGFALTPALSPRRGRMIASRRANQAAMKISTDDLCCSLSPGERVRVRASVASVSHPEFFN